MTNRERIISIIEGKKSDRVPFMPFMELIPQGSFEREMRNRGMGLIAHCSSVWSEMPNVYCCQKTANAKRVTTYHTLVGDVSETYITHAGSISNNGSVRKEFLIKGVKDYEPVIFMIDDTTYHVDIDRFEHMNRSLGEDGITHAWTDEPPFMDAQYFLGYEKWCYEQFDHPEEFSRLLNALERRQERHLNLLLDCPDKYLINIGNLAGNFGPKQFEKFLLPYFKKYASLFKEKGKICTIHADALNLNEFKSLVKSTGIDVVEAFTPPPVGNLSLVDARKSWGEEKTIWINFPETIFFQGYEETKQYAKNLLQSDPCFNKFISFTEMGLMGVDDRQLNIFKDGFRAIVDAIDQWGIY